MNRLTNFLYLAGGMLIGCLAIVAGLIIGGGTTAHAQARGRAETEHPLHHGG